MLGLSLCLALRSENGGLDVGLSFGSTGLGLGLAILGKTLYRPTPRSHSATMRGRLLASHTGHSHRLYFTSCAYL